MLCYRDMTFCPFWEDCKEGEGCFRALTSDVKASAIKFGLGTSQFLEPPECLKRWEHEENK